ncbi:MAG: autotransporter domain-containing protein [Verrucomicrobiota bacterium]
MKRAFGHIFFSALLLAFACQLDARDLLFGAIGGGNPSDLFILNPANGAVISDQGPTGFSITGLRFDPTTGVLYGSTARNGMPSGSLLTINPITGASTVVGSFAVPNHTMSDITFTRNGTLYGWAEAQRDDLHIIDKGTGTATSVGNSGLSTFGSGLAANSRDVLYFTGNGANGALRIVDQNTGQTTVVATLNGAPLPNAAINALAFNGRDTLYAINGGDFGTNSPAHFVTINIQTGAVTDLGSMLNSFDALAFLSTNDPEEFSAIYEVGFSQATVQALNLQRRMDAIREGSRGFCADNLAVTMPSGKDYSGGKGPDGKAVVDKNPVVPAAPGSDNRWGVFVMGTGQFIDVDGSGFDRPGYDITSGGFTLGVDYRVCDNFAVGLYGGYVHGRADFDDQPFAFEDGDLTVDGGQIGLYATWFSGGFYLDGAIGGGYNTYETRRGDLFGPENGSTDGFEFSTFAATGYDFHWRCFMFGPTASLQYTNIDINGFTEDDTSILALNFPDQSEDSLRSTVGLRLSSDWKLWGVIVRTQSRAVWKHEFDDTAYGIDSRFAMSALGTGILTARGPDTGRDSALVSSGFSVLWNQCLSTFANLDTEYGRKNYTGTSVSAGVRVIF